MLMKLQNWSQTVTETSDTAVSASSAMSPCSLLDTVSFELNCMLEHIQLYVELLCKYQL